jgi:hypothetical protein
MLIVGISPIKPLSVSSKNVPGIKSVYVTKYAINYVLKLLFENIFSALNI